MLPNAKEGFKDTRRLEMVAHHQMSQRQTPRHGKSACCNLDRGWEAEPAGSWGKPIPPIMSPQHLPLTSDFPKAMGTALLVVPHGQHWGLCVWVIFPKIPPHLGGPLIGYQQNELLPGHPRHLPPLPLLSCSWPLSHKENSTCGRGHPATIAALAP